MAVIKGRVYENLIGTDPADASPTTVYAPQYKELLEARRVAADLAGKFAAGQLQGTSVPVGEAFCTRGADVDITVTDASSIEAASAEIVAAKVPVKVFVQSGVGYVFLGAIPPDELHALWQKYGV